MGFDPDLFVDKELDDNFLCAICHDVLSNPTTVCADGHTFCSSCIDDWQQQSNECPGCRATMSSKLLCRPFQNTINALQVSCPSRKAQLKDDGTAASANIPPEKDKNRCSWIGTLTDYVEKHRDQECPLRKVACPLGCLQRIHACDVDQHTQQECINRPTRYRRTTQTVSERNDMLLVESLYSPLRKVACPLGCLQRIHACDVDQHTQQECINRPTRYRRTTQTVSERNAGSLASGVARAKKSTKESKPRKTRRVSTAPDEPRRRRRRPDAPSDREVSRQTSNARREPLASSSSTSHITSELRTQSKPSEQKKSVFRSSAGTRKRAHSDCDLQKLARKRKQKAISLRTASVEALADPLSTANGRGNVNSDVESVYPRSSPMFRLKPTAVRSQRILLAPTIPVQPNPYPISAMPLSKSSQRTAKTTSTRYSTSLVDLGDDTKPTVSKRIELDVARIAFGKKVQSKNCKFRYKRNSKQGTIVLFYTDTSGDCIKHEINLDGTSIMDIKYFLNTNYSGMSFLALQVRPDSDNGLKRYPHAYKPLSGSVSSKRKYIAIEFHSCSALKDVIRRVVEDPMLGAFLVKRTSKLKATDAKEYSF